MRKTFLATFIVILAAGGVLGLLSLADSFLSTTVGTLVGIVLALILTAVVVFLFSRTPLWPRGESRWMAPAAVAAGALGGLLGAKVAADPWFIFTELLGWRAAGAAFAGAYPEEIGKAIGVVVILGLFPMLNRPWHGFLVGALAGLGFEMFENIQYGANAGLLHLSSDFLGALDTWGLRTVVAGFLHMVWTALAGWGLGLALYTANKSTAWRVGQGLGWLLLAFMLHFSWNYEAPESISTAKVVLTLLASYGTFIALLVIGWRRARLVRAAEPEQAVLAE